MISLWSEGSVESWGAWKAWGARGDRGAWGVWGGSPHFPSSSGSPHSPGSPCSLSQAHQATQSPQPPQAPNAPHDPQAPRRPPHTLPRPPWRQYGDGVTPHAILPRNCGYLLRNIVKILNFRFFFVQFLCRLSRTKSLHTTVYLCQILAKGGRLSVLRTIFLY